MALLRRCLAEDNVDRYNYTFSVLSLLLLSIVTWLLPLSPYFHRQDDPGPFISFSAKSDGHSAGNGNRSSGGSSDAPQLSEPKLNVKASCWCPPEFTGSMISYTNNICSSAFHRAMQGKTRRGGVSIYNMFPPSDLDFSFVTESTASQVKRENEEFEKLRLANEKQKQEKDASLRFSWVETPLALFLLALGLALPYLVWTLLSCLVGVVNVHETLAVGVAGAGLDRDSRRQLYSDVASAAARSLGSCSWVGGALYILLKLLAFVAALVGLLVVHGELLPRARELQSDIQPAQRHTLVNDKPEKDTCISSAPVNASLAEMFNGKIYVCEFQLKSLSNIQHWSIQCVLGVEEVPEMHSVASAATTQKSADPAYQSRATDSPSLDMYETLFLVVEAHLLVLTIANFISFITWVARLLFAPCRSKVVSSRGQLPLDAVFLLEMARHNAGPEVVAGLAQTWPLGNSEKDREAVAVDEQL